MDEDAKLALLERKSLLPSGVLETIGDFNKGSVVFISGNDKVNFAKGITNFSSRDINKISGLHSEYACEILKTYKKEIIHANSLVLIDGDEYGKIK